MDGVKLEIHNFADKNLNVEAKHLDAVIEKMGKGEYGFINVLGVENFIEATESLVDKLETWVETLVVIGIGGSDLGGRAIQQALDDGYGEINVIFAGDTTDPNEVELLKEGLDLESTIFNIVSKSGTTTETMAHYLYFKNLVRQELNDEWPKHFIFTTDANSGVLHEEGKKHEIIMLPIPGDIGGRYSVLSPVGMFPTAAMGIDIIELIEGGKQAALDFGNQKYESLAWQLAAYQFAHYLEGLKVSVFMPYSIRLYELARWYRQLWAESLGEDGKGIMPVAAWGPADQHSQLQFYADGTNLATYTFIRVEDHGASEKVTNVDIDDLKYLEGVDFADLINIEQEATQVSLTESGKPTMTITLDKVSAKNLGYLFVNLELAVVLLGEMLQMNVFDQPGVEESKRQMYKRLGRPGY